MVDDELQHSRLMARARSAVLSRDYSVAKKIYEEIIAKNPYDNEALHALGAMYVKSGQDKLAFNVYSKILKINGKDVIALNEMGAIYRRSKDYDKSVDMLQRAVIVDETNIQSFYNLGFTYKVVGKYDSAIKAFERVLDVNPNDVLAYNHIGTIYAAKGEHNKAIEFYHRGLLVDTNHPVLHLNMAKSYEALKKVDSADMEFMQTLRIKPLWKDACIEYADFLIENNRLDEADKILDGIVTVNKDIEEITERLKKIEIKRVLSKKESKTIETETKDELVLVQKVSESDVKEDFIEDISPLSSDSEVNVDTKDEKLDDTYEVADVDPEHKQNIDLDKIENNAQKIDVIDNSDFAMERLTEDTTNAFELFEQKLGDQIEADNQTVQGLDMLTTDNEDYSIEEIEENPSDFTRMVGEASIESISDSGEDVYLEEENEEIASEDEIIPLTVTEKPIDSIEDTCSGPLLPVHKSDREKAFEDRLLSSDPKLGRAVDKAIDAVSDKEMADKYKKEVLLFQELSSLSQSLPKNEREYFKESKNNLQLEYLISKMSGKPGLLATSEEVRKILDIEDDQDVMDMDVDVNVLAFKVMSQCRSMIKDLPDKGLAIALDELVKGVLARLY